LEPGAVSFLQNDVNQSADQVGFYVSDYVSASGYEQWGPSYFVHQDGSIDLTYWDQRSQLPGYKPMWTIGPGVEKWSIGLGPFSLPVQLNFNRSSNRLGMMMWDYLVYSPGQIWSGTYMSPFFASQSLDHTSSFDTNAKFDLYSGSDLVGTYVLMDFWSGVPVTPREYRLVSRPFGYPLGRPTPIEGTTQATFTFDTSRSDPNPPVLSHFRIEQNGVRTDMPTGPASIRMQVADIGADFWSQGQTDASDVRLEYRRSGTTAWNPLSLTKTGSEYAAQIAKSGPIDLRVTARDASGNTTQEEWTPAFIGDMTEAPPAAATLVSPSGTVNTTTPPYVWNAVQNASYYQLWVNDSSADGRINKWFTSAEADCASGTGTCSVTLSTALAQGACRWWILTWNDSGYGPWSAPLNFTVASSEEKPGKARLVSPSGSIATTTPAYTWNAVLSSTWYYLWVSDGSGVARIQKWYTSAEAGCPTGSGACSITPAIPLAAGSFQWWIQTWNEKGYGPWSDGMSFTIAASGLPGKATLIAPSGAITTSAPTYSWKAVTGATWYQLWVNDSTTSSGKIKTWYTAEQAGCPSGTGTCSVTPTTALASGAGQWWIQTWNENGYGPWSDGLSFTLESPALGPKRFGFWSHGGKVGM
jgi:hypothetical protein